MFAISGPVDLVDSTEFEIDSSEYGHLWIETSSSTTYVGGKPVVGDYESVGGIDLTSSSVAAEIASQTAGAPSATSATGTIVSATAYGFTLDVSSTYSAVPIILTGSDTTITGTLEAGATATVTGTGSTSTAITASKVTTTATAAATTSQTHVLTADYLGAPDGTTSVTAAEAAPYLTWAQTGVGDADTIQAAGIKTQIYEDPNRTVPDNTLYTTAADGGFAQTCGGVDVTDYTDDVTEYVMNPASTIMHTAYANLLNSVKAEANFNAVFQDDAGPLSEYDYSFSPSLPCDYSDSAWIAGGEALNQAATLPQILSGLSGLDGHDPSELIQELGTSNVLGGNMEECYASSTTIPEDDGWLWDATENTELEVNALDKLFFCMERDTSEASESTAARIYAYASFLLTYNPSLDVMWEDWTTPSGLHVFPEEQLVALDPTVTPTSLSSLEQSGGSYGRVFDECYVAGKSVGECAVVINPTEGADVPFPYTQFTHTLTLSGAGILDGGTLSTDGPAPPAEMDGVGAIIAFP